MLFTYCPNCKETRGFKRAIGIGTWLAVIFTVGLWFIAIPFYPKRCISCGLPYAVSKNYIEGQKPILNSYPAEPFYKKAWFWLLIGFLLLSVILPIIAKS